MLSDTLHGPCVFVHYTVMPSERAEVSLAGHTRPCWSLSHSEGRHQHNVDVYNLWSPQQC